MTAVDVRNELAVRAALGELFQGENGHGGTEIGAADADVHHRLKGFAGASLDSSRAYGVGESEHPFALGHDGLFDVCTTYLGARGLAEGDMKHRTVFGGVDFIAAPHGVDPGAHANRIHELEQFLQNDLVKALPGEVHEETDLLARESLEATRVAREQLPRRHAAQSGGVGSQLCPSCRPWTRDRLLGHLALPQLGSNPIERSDRINDVL